jgi:hypothetical protein
MKRKNIILIILAPFVVLFIAEWIKMHRGGSTTVTLQQQR